MIRQLAARVARARSVVHCTRAGLGAVLVTAAQCCPPQDSYGRFPEPQRIASVDGLLASPLYVIFAVADVTGAVDADGDAIRKIWTRAYTTTEPAPGSQPTNEIPGPTFTFHPGDLVKIDFRNRLNRSANPWLQSFQDNVPDVGPGQNDEIAEQIPHEINIPHNANNTNLHTHGLHVDPQQDNVTLLLLPEDDDPGNYVPELQRLVPDITHWWRWQYEYRIPGDHLPGTHWYHAHKHGATSTHVENGMAGTIVIRPNDDANAIVPGLWATGHDRVMVIQEIANYGAGQGTGRGPDESGAIRGVALNTPDLTVNGQHQPRLQLPPGQTERWRFVIAGANHRTTSYLWAGKVVLPRLPDELHKALAEIETKEQAQAYVPPPPPPGQRTSPPPERCFPAGLTGSYAEFPGRVRLVAVDGVTMSQAVKITKDSPSFGAAGNRNDWLVQADADASGVHYVFKGYPQSAPPLASFVEAYPDLFGSNQGEKARWRYTALSEGMLVDGQSGECTATPAFTIARGDGFPARANLLTDPYDLRADFTSHKVQWPTAVDAEGEPVPIQRRGQWSIWQETPIAPLIAGTEDPTTGGVQPNIRSQEPRSGGLGWQPLATPGGGGAVTDDYLVVLDLGGSPSGPPLPDDDALDARLNRLSPTGGAKDTLLVSADRKGTLTRGIPSYASPIPARVDGRQVIVFDRSQLTFQYTPTAGGSVQQFRQFWLNGRQFSLMDFVGNPKAPKLVSMPIASVEPELGHYVPNAAEKTWTHLVGGKMFLTNPGYWLPLANVGTEDEPRFNYDYDHPGPLLYSNITGLEEPRQPVATTAEEWLLVNNSDLFHPFHIHISPFFVTEVGQLDYDGDAKSWSMKKLDDSSPLAWVVNNWWDVILLPPHGYVKMRTWLNIPDQRPSDPSDPESPLEVVENANVYGSWVYHCHILRHEDRGMMMMVNVKAKLLAMPDVTGNTVAAAERALEPLGLSLVWVDGEGLPAPDPVPRDWTVSYQVPEAGTKVRQDVNWPATLTVQPPD